MLHQPNFPPIDEWIRKMWYIYYNGILLSHKKNEILPFATWMDLESCMLSEISQTEKVKSMGFHLYVECKEQTT